MLRLVKQALIKILIGTQQHNEEANDEDKAEEY